MQSRSAFREPASLFIGFALVFAFYRRIPLGLLNLADHADHLGIGKPRLAFLPERNIPLWGIYPIPNSRFRVEHDLDSWTIIEMSQDPAEPVILLAEDSENDVVMFRRAFRQAGFHNPIQVVSDGEEALAYLKGEGKFANRDEYPLPTLMLLDLKMPRLNGFEVLQWLREEISLRSLVVVVLTTSDRVQDINRAYKLGANSFLTKPLNMEEFRQMITSLYQYWMFFNRPPQTKRPAEGNGHGHPQNGTAKK